MVPCTADAVLVLIDAAAAAPEMPVPKKLKETNAMSTSSRADVRETGAAALELQECGARESVL